MDGMIWMDWPGGGFHAFGGAMADSRAFDAVPDDEWAKLDDATKARMVEKEFRRVADLLMADFRPRTPWTPRAWQRIEQFLNRGK